MPCGQQNKVRKYASMPKALPLTGCSQKAHSLSPIFSLQLQHNKWPERHWAILVLRDISSRQMGHRGIVTLLFLLELSSIFNLIDSDEASSLFSKFSSIDSYFLFNSMVPLWMLVFNWSLPLLIWFSIELNKARFDNSFFTDLKVTFSPFSRVICPTKFKNWRTLKSFWGIIYHICGVSLPPIPGHLEVWGTQRIDILIKVILHCKMVQIGHFQRVIREVSRGCLMVPIILTCQDMSIFRWSGEILKKNLTGLA